MKKDFWFLIICYFLVHIITQYRVFILLNLGYCYCVWISKWLFLLNLLLFVFVALTSNFSGERPTSEYGQGQLNLDF